MLPGQSEQIIFERFLQPFQCRKQNLNHLSNRWTCTTLNILIFTHVRDCICARGLIDYWDKEFFSVEWIFGSQVKEGIWKERKCHLYFITMYGPEWTWVQFLYPLFLCLGLWINYSVQLFQMIHPNDRHSKYLPHWIVLYWICCPRCLLQWCPLSRRRETALPSIPFPL